jgi:WhiB family redox-sensing transcriptional regulator
VVSAEWWDEDEEDYWRALLASTATEADTLSLAEQFAERRPRWQEDAACRGLGPDLFYSDAPVDVAEARAICSTCLVVAECRDYGEGEQYGVWGGVDRERRAQRRERRRSAA